jgi:lipoate-protein ligase A
MTLKMPNASAHFDCIHIVVNGHSSIPNYHTFQRLIDQCQPNDITIHEFKDLMIRQIMGIDDIKDAKRYELTDEDPIICLIMRSLNS